MGVETAIPVAATEAAAVAVETRAARDPELRRQQHFLDQTFSNAERVELVRAFKVANRPVFDFCGQLTMILAAIVGIAGLPGGIAMVVLSAELGGEEEVVNGNATETVETSTTVTRPELLGLGIPLIALTVMGVFFVIATLMRYKLLSCLFGSGSVEAASNIQIAMSADSLVVVAKVEARDANGDRIKVDGISQMEFRRLVISFREVNETTIGRMGIVCVEHMPRRRPPRKIYLAPRTPRAFVRAMETACFPHTEEGPLAIAIPEKAFDESQ